MEIENLKELKESLSKIPDDVLEIFGCAVPSDGGEKVGLCCFGEIGEGNDVNSEYLEQMEKHPVLKVVGRWIDAVIQEQKKFDKNPEDESVWERDCPISSSESKNE